MFRDDRLAGSWQRLAARLDAGKVLDRWAEREPALAGLTSVDDLAEATRQGGAPDRADEVLGALVRWATADGGDDPDAVLVVVHLLANGVQALAARFRDVDGDVLWLVVGELAAQVRAFPWRRRRRAFAANLLLDTRRALAREFGMGCSSCWRRAEVLVGVHLPSAGFDVAGPGPEAWPATAGEELVDLLTWAIRRRVVSLADVTVLWQLECLRGPARTQLAAGYGVTVRSVCRRREQAVAALRHAYPRYLAAVA
jgi:hypothetical protein